MISIYMIIAALVPTALTKGSMECNVSRPTGVQQCFGALGEPLIFHLPTNGPQIILKKENVKIFTLDTKNMKKNNLHAEYRNHSAFLTEETFKLNNAQRERDSGVYQLETYNSDGRRLYEINMHLEIQAPVLKPSVSQICLSPERMNISCSSEGDRVEFFLTLDGHSLMRTRGRSRSPSSSTVDTPSLTGSSDNQQKLEVSNITISLHGQLTGSLMCNVRNNVSREETVIQLTSCNGSPSHFSLVAVAVIASVATLLLLLALFLGIKHLNKKARPVTANEDNAEDEVVYSDVRVLKQTRKTRPN